MPQVVLPPAADAFVTEGTSSGNGVAVGIEVNNQGGGFETTGLVKLDLSSLPNTVSIDSVIYQAGDALPLDNAPSITAHRLLDDNWSETTVNGLNRPNFDPNPSTTFGINPDRFSITVNLTPDVKAGFPGKKVFSWIFIQRSTPPSFLRWASKEATEVQGHFRINYTEGRGLSPFLIVPAGLALLGAVYFLTGKRRK